MVVFDQIGCIWANWFYVVKIGSIELVLFGKWVVFGEIGSIWAKLVVFRQNGYIWRNWLYLGKIGCTWAKLV